MQKTYRYLANNKVTILADLAGVITEYRPVYQRTLQVYKGIDNTLWFEVKNHDQKPVSLAGYTPTILVYDENKNLIIERSGTVQEDTITRSTVISESAPDTNLEFSTVSGISVGQTVTGTYIKPNTLVTDVDTVNNVVTLNKSPKDSVPLGEQITFTTNSKRGVFTVTISDNDLLNIRQQYLHYVIYLTNSIGDKTITYSNAHFDAKGLIYVSGQALPGPLATYSVESFSGNGNTPTAWYTEEFDAQPAINGNSALHTAAIYNGTFAGNVVIEGTLENQITLDTFWAEVDSVTLSGTETEPVPVNFNGVFTYLRFKTESDPTGLEKILVRN